MTITYGRDFSRNTKCKKKNPNILIEAHPRGVVHPHYYQHGLPDSFDENWGFECMWNPLEDLLSHQAFQLYEYNLAYSIPLYLHINENSDNENMLQFWWYASVVRHLGIGGLNNRNSKKFLGLKNAVILYKKIKPFLVRGKFYGIDPTTHLHLLEDRKGAVIIAVNLTSKTVSKIVKLNMTKYPINFQSGEIRDGLNNQLFNFEISHEHENVIEIKTEIPPLSPRIIILC